MGPCRPHSPFRLLAVKKPKIKDEHDGHDLYILMNVSGMLIGGHSTRPMRYLERPMGNKCSIYSNRFVHPSHLMLQ
jgi:hypothetical protein